MKQGQGITRRIITLVLTIAMLFGLACTPIGRVQASAAEAPMDDTPMTIAAASGPVVADKGDGTYDVTFSYSGAANDVKLCSSMPGVGWGQTWNMVQGSDNVWTTTVTGLQPGTYAYKFVVDSDWGRDQNNSFHFGKDDNSIVAVGYESPHIEGNSVTFTYIPTNGEHNIKIAGSMEKSEWTINNMESNEDGTYTYTFNNLEAKTYEYKFIIYETDHGTEKESYVNDPANKDPLVGKDNNSQFTIKEPSESFDPESIISPEINGKQVTFRYYAPDAENVWLAGDMTNWKPGAEKMDKDSHGVWSITKELSDGGYEYKFLVNDNIGDTGWARDPKNPYYGPSRDIGANNFVPVGYQSPVEDETGVTIIYHSSSAKPGTVQIAGDMTNWEKNPLTMDGGENGFFTYKFTDLTPGNHEYKIINNGTWYADPANTMPLSNGNTQFEFPEIEPPETSSPEPTEVISPEVSDNTVTFRYEDSSANDVWLTGSLNSWIPERMTLGDNGVWTITRELTPGGYTYKFLVNDIESGWMNDPKNPYRPTGSTGDNFVPVGYQSPLVEGANVTITYHNTSEQSIEIAGDMTNWDFVEMTPGPDGFWSHTFENLTEGQHLYKLHIVGTGDEGWFTDPANLEELCGEGNNNQFTINESGSVETPEFVSPEVNGDTVIFRYADKNTTSVQLAGSMTNWESNPKDMTKDESTGIWSITLNDLESGTYQYKFIVDDQPEWLHDPKNPFTGSNDAGLGNSFVTVGYTSPTVDGSNVTIRYQTKNDDKSVQVAGSMAESNWNGINMTSDGNGVYTYTFRNLPNGTYQYKLIIDGKWVADPSNPCDLVEEYNKNSTFEVTGSTQEAVKSPEVVGHNVTIRYQGSANTVELMGTLPGTDWNTDKNPLLKENNETGIWEITLPDVPAGKYEYKFHVNGNSWVTDSFNPKRGENDNAIVVVPGLAPPVSQTVKTGSSLTLPAKLHLFEENGNSSEVEVAYTLNGDYEGVTLENGTLTVPETFEGTSIALTAAHNDETVDVTVNVVTQLYTYNIYFFDWTASRMDINASELWLWYDGKEGSAYPFTSTEKIGEKTWLKATVQFPVTQLGVIVRSQGNWDWQTKPNYELSNTEGKESRNAYVVFGQGLTMDTPPDLPEEQGRVFYVPGTFPGNSWDAASNKMTASDKGEHIYSYTFKDVPPATYEFKISVNGSWDENYGAEGKKDGGNYSITVPEQMDVTLYYSDVTHLAVTNLNYQFVKPFVTGQELETPLALNDAGLTGIYSGTVSLKAGHYENLALQVTEDTIGTFPEFTLETDRDITFYYSPVSKIWYSDAVEWDDTAEVYYDSKDLTYKNPFGAVPTDTPVTFAVDTASTITSVALVVGMDQYPMDPVPGAPAGQQRWSTEVSFSSIGELKYHFIVSQLGGVKVYCDDDGYYGTGILTDLIHLKPYDLVVYENGYKTPDWMKNAVIYQIFPDRFFNTDPSNDQAQTSARGPVKYEFPAWDLIPENPEQEGKVSKDQYLATGAYFGDGEWSNEIYGGDLKGITEKVEYLKSLGVSVIYLNPIFASISNHRYDTSDYTKIDPILGTMEDYKELVAAAEANGMHIILDGVFNHVSDDSIYFDRYYKYLDAGTTKIGAYPYWAYVYDYMKEHSVQQTEAEEAAKEHFRTEYHIADFSYTTWFDIFNAPMEGSPKDKIGQRTDKPVYAYDGWWGYDSMPIIKSTNGSEFQTEAWAKDIITDPDSVTRYWLQNGNDGWRLDVANEVSDETWRNFRKVVKSEGDFVIIGEIWDDATKYLLGDMYDSVMNYMFRNAVTAFAMGTDATKTTKEMEKLRERYPKEAFYAMMNLVDSHDTSRVLSYLDGIADDREDATLATAFPHYDTTSPEAKEMQKLVAFLQFTYAGAPTIYYGDERGMVGADDPDDRRTIADWDNVTDQGLLDWYKELGALRTNNSVLRTGSVAPFDTKNSHVLGFVRSDAEQTLIVLANNSSSDQTITLSPASLDIESDFFLELLSGNGIEAVNGVITVTVPAYRGVVLSADGGTVVPPVDVPDEPDPPVESDPPVVTPEPSDEPTTPPTTEPTQEPSTPPTTEPQDPTTPPTTEPTEEPSQTPSEEPETPPATEDPAPPATQQPTPPTYYPQPSEPTTSTAPAPSDTPAPSTAPAASASPSPSPSAPVEDLPDIDVPLAGLPVLETTIRPSSAMKDGVLTAEIQDSLQDAILDHVKANKSTTVVVAPDFDEKSTHNDVILPGALLDSLSDVGNVDVRVETPVGNVTIPEAALEQLGTAKQVTVCVQKSEDSVTVNVKADGKTLAAVPGSVKTALQLEGGQVAVLVDKSGKETVLPKSIVEDGTTYAILPGSGTVKVVSRTALFQDVPADTWYTDAVAFASSHEIFAGVSESEMLFAPNMDVDRSMAATMLWALESKVNPKTTASFPDVAADKWYAASVAWASENGIVAGYSNGAFAPADTITREQFATMLYNYAKYLGLDTAHNNRMQTFSDADTVSSWSAEAMEWAVGKGIINGNGNQELKPKDSISRAQAAAALQNLVALIVK